MPTVDDLFAPTNDPSALQSAGAAVSIIYATALANSANGEVLVQIGEPVTPQDNVSVPAEANPDQFPVDFDEGTNEMDSVGGIDEDVEDETLGADDVADGMPELIDAEFVTEDDEDVEDSTGEVVNDG